MRVTEIIGTKLVLFQLVLLLWGKSGPGGDYAWVVILFPLETVLVHLNGTGG